MRAEKRYPTTSYTETQRKSARANKDRTNITSLTTSDKTRRATFLASQFVGRCETSASRKQYTVRGLVQNATTCRRPSYASRTTAGKKITVDGPQVGNRHRVYNPYDDAYSLSHSCTRHACNLSLRLPPIRPSMTRRDQAGCAVRRDAGCVYSTRASQCRDTAAPSRSCPFARLEKKYRYIYLYKCIFSSFNTTLFFILSLYLNKIKDKSLCIAKQVYIKVFKERKKKQFRGKINFTIILMII